MYQARVQSILKDTQVPQAQFGKTLINKVYRGVDVESNRGLQGQLPLHKGLQKGKGSTYRINVSCKINPISRAIIILIVRTTKRRRIRSHQTQRILLVHHIIKSILKIRRGNQPSQHAVSEDRQTAVQLAGHKEILELRA